MLLKPLQQVPDRQDAAKLAKIGDLALGLEQLEGMLGRDCVVLHQPCCSHSGSSALATVAVYIDCLSREHVEWH